MATTSGLGIIDTLTESLINFVSYQTGINSVWADNERVYLATSNSGIRYINLEDVETTTVSKSFVDSPLITGSDVVYLHGSSDRMLCCTNKGVDIMWLDSTGSIVKTNISGATKCFVSHNYYFYYVMTSGTNQLLNRANDLVSNNWQPDYTLKTGVGPLSGITCLTDFYVTANTATNGIGNTIFMATTSGVFAFDEDSLDYILLQQWVGHIVILY